VEGMYGRGRALEVVREALAAYRAASAWKKG
jgi:hypothetical protein